MGIPFKQYLYGAITFTTVLMGLLKVSIFQTPDTALQELAVFTLYFAFLAWAGGQLWLIRVREREQARRPPGDLPAVAAVEEIPLDDGALRSAETYLNLGESIDTVCAMIEPRFADWDVARREAFRENLWKAMRERRSKPDEGAHA